MKICCISDLHGELPDVGTGDLLIIAGDLIANQTMREYRSLARWMQKQDFHKIVLIAGNHDGELERFYPSDIQQMLFPMATYLQDSQTEYDGMKIWGSPWTPTHYDWHFMKDRGQDILERWNLIPDDIDILVTHGPPFGIQDNVEWPEKSAGCEDLRRTIDTRLKKLKLHVFGHIHRGYGKVEVNGITYVNASIMDESYDPVNKPIVVYL